MNDKDAERYNRFQETGENQGEEMSITDGSNGVIPTQQNTPKNSTARGKIFIRSPRF